MHYTALVQLPPMDIMLPVRLIAMPLQRPQHFPNMVKYEDLNYLEEIIAIINFNLSIYLNMHCLIPGSATGPHGHDPGLISRDDDKKALSGKHIFHSCHIMISN